jgi:hypothetical protein
MNPGSLGRREERRRKENLFLKLLIAAIVMSLRITC